MIYMCVLCGFIYQESEGLPDQAIQAGTPWSSLPDDWRCPDCEGDKKNFDVLIPTQTLDDQNGS